MIESANKSFDILEYESFLKNYGYSIESDTENIFRIERKQPVSRLLVLIVFFLGLGLLAVSILFIKDVSLMVLGTIMLLFPLINRGWKFPTAVVVDRVENFLTVESGLLFKSYKLFKVEDIEEIALHRVVKSTEVNPFNDGSKEHIYIFSFSESSKAHQIMRLVSRKNIDQKAKDFSSHMNRLVK